MTSLTEIELSTKSYADAREELTKVVNRVNQLQEKIHARYLRDIKRLLAKAAERQVKLAALIEGSPTLFTKPRTLIVHGIKIGFRKGKGGIEWDDDAQVVKLIKKLFPEQADLLIHTEETPVKNALSELPAADLKRLGITVEDTGDVVVIKPVDSAVDKIVKALLKNATEEKEAA